MNNVKFSNIKAIANAIEKLNEFIKQHEHFDDEAYGDLCISSAVLIDHGVIKDVDHWIAEQSEQAISVLKNYTEFGFARTDGTYVLYALAHDIVGFEYGVLDYSDLKEFDNSKIEELATKYFDNLISLAQQ